MNLTVSPQIKILALVGLLAAVGLAASMLVLGGSSKKTATPAVTTPAVHVPVKAHTTHVQAPTKHTAKKHRAVPVTAKPATKTHATTTHHKAKAKPTGFHGNPVYAQLPQALQWQLAHHKVVVVSFYNPSSEVDAISVAEAHAGATDAGAGFLLVSVLDNKVAGILTALLPGGGLLPEPGVLIYRAPATSRFGSTASPTARRSLRQRRTRCRARAADCGDRDAGRGDPGRNAGDTGAP